MAQIQINKVVLIAGNAEVAELVSQLFRKEGSYFTVFESPEGRGTDYGFTRNACVKICNTTKMIRPETVIIGGCSKDTTEIYKRSLSGLKIVELPRFQETELSAIKGYMPKAKRKSVRILRENETADGDVVAVEGSEGYSYTMAVNLALAAGSKLCVLADVGSEKKSLLEKALSDWNSGHSGLVREDGKAKVFELLTSQVAALLEGSPTSVSFVCGGTPYGILPFQCPTTHYFSYPSQLGLNIVRGLVKTTLSFPRVPLALLCDPDTTGDSEFFEVRDILGKDNGYVVRSAYKKMADSYLVGMLIEHLPSDIILLSAHAGEMTGERITTRFSTPDGKVHEVIHDRVLNFSGIPDEDKIQVQEFMRFVSIDGVAWPIRKDFENRKMLVEAHKYYIDQKMEDLKFGETVKIEKTGPIKSSDAIGMARGEYIPMLHDCGGHNFPVAVGNACSTWRELSGRFSFAGASVFIGTALDISNGIAKEVMVSFFKRVCKGQSLGHALYMSQKKFSEQLGYTPYLMHGFIHTAVPPLRPFNQNIIVVRKELLKVRQRWSEELSDVEKNSDLFENIERIIKFIDKEIEHTKAAARE